MKSCFKAYDIRGKLEEELNDEIAYKIGRAFAKKLKPHSVVVGGDIRLTSEELKLAVANGLRDEGVNVIDIGMSGTEEIYFATQHLKVDGGIEVTASHNPVDYNGMKLVKENARPISADTGLKDIEALVYSGFINPEVSGNKGQLTKVDIVEEFSQYLLDFINLEAIKPMTLVVNSGNGAAGHIVDALEVLFKEKAIPIDFIKIHHEPDGHFPNGIPNPILPENRAATSDAVIEYKADLGIAWDGDFDRCFLFDEKGQFIEGYYIVGLLAEAFLQKHPGAKIVHDPRLTWNTIDIVQANGGIPVLSKCGHAFIKEIMRAEDAIYGGEMSAHHYFKDFAYCDSGMIPWLLIVELLSKKDAKLSQLVAERINKYPSSGEINRRLVDPDKAIEQVLNKYKPQALKIDTLDGISMEFECWRFNLRKSNTEPVVRLNVESRGDEAVMRSKTQEIVALLEA
ncbi:phosphomannomutase CpsG [Kangiella sp. TOML190]|uniref:phosphomannomutase CpsG n=1 Tax=Kangiella sp. TOML190 TaxID=2931351 RepID=UPI002559521A|nr:phosphomannomutase CpsG [Kangiella sp. TOML190]